MKVLWENILDCSFTVSVKLFNKINYISQALVPNLFLIMFKTDIGTEDSKEKFKKRNRGLKIM